MDATARTIQGGDGMSIMEILALIGWGLAIAFFVLWSESMHYYIQREEDLNRCWRREIKRQREECRKCACKKEVTK